MWFQQAVVVLARLGEIAPFAGNDCRQIDNGNMVCTLKNSYLAE